MPDSLPQDQPNARRRWMSILARSDADSIARGLQAAGEPPGYQRLRGPEPGLVMVRGRAGGGGAPFNLGEMTVTRCTVRTDAGLVGHAYIAGRDERRAELAALADALLQDPVRHGELLETLVEPLHATLEEQRADIAAKAAATRVQFFAMRNMRT